jgi:cell division septation protein DedD
MHSQAVERHLMAKLTSRDYKSNQSRPMDLRRYREFAWGAAVGVVLTAIAFLYVGAKLHKAPDPPDAPHPDSHRAAHAGADAGVPAEPAPTYGFYTMLPNEVVVVPEKEKDKDLKHDAPAAARVERPGIYVLQVAATHSEPDANGARDRLRKMGFDAKVQRVAVDADVWYRVRVGPFSNLDELNKTRKQLQSDGTDTTLIRVGE